MKRNAKKNNIFINFRKKFFNKKKEISFSLSELIITGLICVFLGLIIGLLITYGRNTVTGKRITPKMQEFINTYEKIHDEYYGTLDEKKLFDDAISGMMKSLDDLYSSYYGENVSDKFNEEITGEYVGIGVTVQSNENGNEVIDVSEGYAGDKAGIKVGDIIIKVNKKDVTNIYGDDLANLIRGKENTKVKITVIRDEKQITYTLNRTKVGIETVFSQVYEKDGKKIGVLDISQFSSNTSDQFSNHLKKLEKKKIDYLVIDVRDNLGGQLTQVQDILSLFFDKNTVLFQLKDSKKTTKVKDNTKDKRSYPVAVLINECSASASEVLASCFQENYKKSFIVGTTSYGKGTVQKIGNFNDGTTIKYTTDKWLTSKGKWLNKKGVNPDYDVELENVENMTYDNDCQFQKAIELFLK